MGNTICLVKIVLLNFLVGVMEERRYVSHLLIMDIPMIRYKLGDCGDCDV